MSVQSADFQQVPIDRVRHYWNSRPCNLRHSAKPIGTREYFDDVEARKYFVEPHIPQFAEPERWRGKKVLEIGCGIGTDTVNFARHGAWVTAVDVSEKSFEIARHRAKVYGLEDRIRFYHGNSEKLTQFLPVDGYDLVYSFGVIHHSPYPEAILDQLRHYVHPQSEIKIVVYHRYSWKVFWIVLTYGMGRFWRLRELVARHSEAQTGPYSRKEAEHLLASGGFQTSSACVDHIFPYRIRDYVRYRYVKNWYFRWMPQKFFRWLEQNFGWHLCVSGVPVSASPGGMR